MFPPQINIPTEPWQRIINLNVFLYILKVEIIYKKSHFNSVIMGSEERKCDVHPQRNVCVNKTNRFSLSVSAIVCILALVFTCVSVSPCRAIKFLGHRETYGKYPAWNACSNASISFEFKSRNNDGLLMYTEDNGGYNYLQVIIQY